MIRDPLSRDEVSMPVFDSPRLRARPRSEKECAGDDRDRAIRKSQFVSHRFNPSSSQCRAAPHHSNRNATSGSVFAARRAGIKHEITAAETSTNPTAPSVIGSVGEISKSNVCSSLVSPNAAASPITIPVNPSPRPCRSTMRKMSRASRPWPCECRFRASAGSPSAP